MPVTRSARLGDFAVAVQVPSGPGRLVRRLLRPRSSSRPSSPPQVGRDEPGAPPRLEIGPTPTLAAAARDREAAMGFWRAGPAPAPAPAPPPAGGSLAREVAALSWYHTMELPGGVVTPGYFDHRPLLAHYGLPEDLSGLRALDVATFDGFWAFELERRGASVTALDLPRASNLDFPAGLGRQFVEEGLDTELGRSFAVAARALGSSVQRVARSVYQLAPETHGTFDLVHVGDLLLHLRDPMAALARVRSVTEGVAHIVDCFDDSLADPAGRHLLQYLGGWDRVVWWLPSLETLAQMVLDAGFGEVEVVRVYRLGTVDGPGFWRAVLRARP